MAETTEPRALSAALASPAFVTQGGGSAMHAANRHVERWAPEAGASRVRSLRNLGFVDRLVAPWVEAAQRSASLRMFSQYISTGMGERQGGAVSWVFPRPWYQDELDWMSAARQTSARAHLEQPAPSMLTTRGTYVPPVQTAQTVVPAALYEFVAPSLATANGDYSVRDGSVMRSAPGEYGTRSSAAAADAYSPLVPFAAAHAAQMMARVVAPFAAGAQAPRMSPGLRSVLATMLERSARSGDAPVTRLAGSAPELVTPPAPRADEPAAAPSAEQQVIRDAAEQHAHIAELQRIARVVAARELAAREAAAASTSTATGAALAKPATASAATATPAAASADVERARIEARVAERLAERERAAQVAEAQRERSEQASEQQRAEQTQRQRTEQAQRQVAEQAQRQVATQRLHEQAREAAARDAREAATREPAASDAKRDTTTASEPRATAPSLPVELTSAIAALPPELAAAIASGIGQHPDRAVQAIRELDEALRAVELIARTSADGGTFEATRGPRLVLPAGLGGLVATVERAHPVAPRALAPFASLASGAPAQLQAQAAASRTAARVPAMTWIDREPQAAPTSALAAATGATPAALNHVAWADRWLARFAGAGARSLDTLDVASAAPHSRLVALAEAAPGSVFVAPELEAMQSRAVRELVSPEGAASPSAAQPVLRSSGIVMPASLRIDDDAETPDDVFAAISAAASRSRGTAAAPARASAPALEPAQAALPRDTIADLVAHAAPSAPGAGFAAQLASSPFAPALRHVLPLPAAPSFDVRALFGSGLAASYLAGLLQTSGVSLQASGQIGASERATASLDWSPTYVSAESPESGEARSPRSEALSEEPITTVRSSLLSWDVEATGAMAPTVTATGARRLVDALALPMLGEPAAVREPAGSVQLTTAGAPQLAGYAAPGMIADRAHAWSVMQERSASDLAFDFVSPELVLAARVYGLGAAEAAQAARLAIAGPGQLAAMASAVDRTFVQMMSLAAEQRGEMVPGRARAQARDLATAYPTASGDVAAVIRPQAAPASGAMFGVERKAPRGAFLWPSATVAALGLNAAMPDGEQSMSVAALELLAAQAVAEMGTYAAPADMAAAMGEARPGAETGSGSMTSTGPGATTAAGAMTAAGTGAGTEAEIFASAAAMVPAAKRAKFEALYLSLSQRGGSPAARAAQAVALAGRGDDAISARERAALAWDVLPVVYATAASEPLSTGAVAARDARRRAELRSELAESRPGLAMLSARAGEALGSYVAPATEPRTASAAASREAGAVMRVPSAAQELVRTGRPSGRHGGGEVDIPPWFEAAARKMFEDKSGSTDGISLAELTLVSAAPSSQVAASSRAAPSATPPTPSVNKAASMQQTPQIDVEKLANDVYRQILVLMEAARARNGEPYL